MVNIENINISERLTKIIGLALGITSLFFVAEAFFFLVMGYDFYWIEPNKFIAGMELIISILAMFILTHMLYKICRAK